MQSCGCLASPPLGLRPHLSLGGCECCSNDRAINSDDSGNSKESAGALYRKETKKGSVWAQAEKKWTSQLSISGRF